MDGLYTDPGEFYSKHAAVISIILIIFAIGTQYAYLDSTTHKAADNSDPGSLEEELVTMFNEEIRLLPEIIESSSLERVQAYLLFAAYSLPIDSSGLRYIYLSLTIRLAMQNGMHRKYTGNALHPSMIEIRNRVWWTAYTMERYTNTSHFFEKKGRMPTDWS
jgi:Fungal specific transcription factor domain